MARLVSTETFNSAVLEQIHQALGNRDARAARQMRSLETLADCADVRLSPMLHFIVQTLTDFPTLRASRVFEMVRARGYTGGLDHFRSVVACLRPRRHAEA